MGRVYFSVWNVIDIQYIMIYHIIFVCFIAHVCCAKMNICTTYQNTCASVQGQCMGPDCCGWWRIMSGYKVHACRQRPVLGCLWNEIRKEYIYQGYCRHYIFVHLFLQHMYHCVPMEPIHECVKKIFLCWYGLIVEALLLWRTWIP